MKILFTGKGTAGSWQCRGIQPGSVLGKAKPKATLKDCQAADVIVVVKRINGPFIDNVRDSGKPWIWDMVDLYPQPECSTWSREQAIKWVRQQIKAAKPDGIIWPNQRMLQDCQLPGVTIYHHARHEPINPIRERISVVGYNGSEKFLGKWRGILESECRRRGWEFKINIPLNQMDIVVAYRDAPHNGYAQVHWKSNVKLANAHGTGTPFIGQPEASYLETQTGYEKWAESRAALSEAFDALESFETRKSIHQGFLKNTITLESVTDQIYGYAREIRTARA